MIFESKSQAGQDLWAYKMLVEPDNLFNGTFLDIGCNEPVAWNNTYALEQLGWTGLLMDNNEGCFGRCRVHRKANSILADATTFNWDTVGPKDFYYLSLDVDEATPDALANLLKFKIGFRAATIEHDSYRFGMDPRNRMRDMMEAAGYLLLCRDVNNNDPAFPFEDWWVNPHLVNMAVASRFLSFGCGGRQIAKR